MAPEENARQAVDELLGICGWIIRDRSQRNMAAVRDVANREVSLEQVTVRSTMLFVDGKAVEFVEAQPKGIW